MASREEIERLAALLDGSSPGGESAEDRKLGALATMLREAQPEVPPMRAEFRASLRQDVVAAAREQVVEPALMTRIRAAAQRFKYSTGLAGATGMASVALAGGGVAGAAEHAQPGDVLYGTKLTIEDLRLATTFDDLARGRRATVYAADRLGEAETALAEGDEAGAATALRGAAARNDEARPLILASGDMPALLDLFDAIESQTATVTRLADGLTGDAAAAARSVLDGLEESREAIGVVLPGVLEPPAPPASPATPPPVGTTPPAVAPGAPEPPAGPAPAQPPVDGPGPPTSGPDPVVPPVDDLDLPDLPDVPDVEPPIDGSDGPLPDVPGAVEDPLEPLPGQ